MFKVKNLILSTIIFMFISVSLTFANELFNGKNRSDVYDQQMNLNEKNGIVEQEYQMGNVKLVYSSNVGWKLSGYSIITRSTRKGVPTYDDTKDTFYLGGEELVIITTGTNSLVYRTKKESFKKISLMNPNATTSYWIVYNPDGSTELYGSSNYYLGSTSRFLAFGGNTALNKGFPRAWAIAQMISRGGYDVTNFEYINISGEYLLERIISGKSGCVPDKMTFIDYAYNPTYIKKDYRAGCEVLTQHYPLIVYTFSGTTTTVKYSWLSDYQGKPFASRVYLDIKHATYIDYNLTGLYYINSTFDESGKWQVNAIIPYGNDTTINGITRYSNEIVKTWESTTGTSLNPTKYDYYAMNPTFSETAETWKANTNDFWSISDNCQKDAIADFLDINGNGLPIVLLNILQQKTIVLLMNIL